MTTGSHAAGYRVPIKFSGRSGLILLEQIRTLDKRRFIRRLGAVDRKTQAALLATLRELFAD